jgi:hypothetical protein
MLARTSGGSSELGAGGAGFKVTAESVHGSILVVGEMLKHTGDFMIPR